MDEKSNDANVQSTQQAPSPPPVNTYVPPNAPGAPAIRYLKKPWVIVLLMLIGVGILYAVFSSIVGVSPVAEKPSITSVPTVPVEEPSQAPEVTQVSWEKYEAVGLNLTFEHPADWVVVQFVDNYVDQNGEVIGYSRLGLVPEKDLEKGAPINPIIRIYEWDNPKNLPLKDYDDAISYRPVGGGIDADPLLYSLTTKQETVNDLSVYHDLKANCHPLTCDQYVIPRGGKFIEMKRLQRVNPETHPEYELNEIFFRLVSTVKFL